jgi:myo-inositol-1-phosphate synthase
VAKELGRFGALKGPSAFTQKTPPVPMTFANAMASCEKLSQRLATFDENV